MPTQLYRKRLQLDCWATLDEKGNRLGAAPRLADPPASIPDLLVGRSMLSVLIRCPDDGEVEIDLWAGDPGPPPKGWRIAFEGMLETVSRGFDLGTLLLFSTSTRRPEHIGFVQRRIAAMTA